MNELNVLSLNIWFDEYCTMERTNALLACIYKHNPDVICLQEVRPVIYEKLIKNLKKYEYHYPKTIKYNYGCIIFSKYKISKCATVPFKKSNMGRELIIVKIDYPYKVDGNTKMIEIVVCTTHLESEFNRDSPNLIKASQIDESFSTLQSIHEQYRNVIFCLDSNLTPDDEISMNFPFNKENGWDDAWISKGNADNRYTFDGKKNVFLKQRKCRYRSRLDRILSKTDNCQLQSFNLIESASDCILSYMSPSDHFCISGKFRVIY
jgi:exonuclease III